MRGRRGMRLRAAAVAAMAVLAGCSPSPPADKARVTLNNPYWDRANVQLVITKSTDCDNQAAYLDTRELVMAKNRLEIIDVPADAILCWRRDRNPNNPAPGVWTNWSKAPSLFPGRNTNADL